MKHQQFGSSAGNRWRFKSTVKAFMICLFAFSAVFITYQLIYYVNLTEYQFQENQSRHQELRSEAKSSGAPPPAEFHNEFVVGDFNPGKAPARGGGSDRKPGKTLLTSKILGVNPTDLHLYLKRGGGRRDSFKCFSTGVKISWDKVNDDFCDCPKDGSDEPSTAACVNGHFHCLRKDGTIGYIPSSRVNDGICDCKDGTDEHDGHANVKCK